MDEWIFLDVEVTKEDLVCEFAGGSFTAIFNDTEVDGGGYQIHLFRGWKLDIDMVEVFKLEFVISVDQLERYESLTLGVPAVTVDKEYVLVKGSLCLEATFNFEV